MLLVPLLSGIALTSAEASSTRPIVLPIESEALDNVSWTDTFGAGRSGGRRHKGVDMLGQRMVPLLAAVDGVVARIGNNRLSGNHLRIEDSDGWTYHYIHINNDSPGTDDGRNLPEHAFAPGIEPGVRVEAGQTIAYMGDSGNAEWVAPMLHFEIRRPDGTAINPTASVDAAKARIKNESLIRSGPYPSGSELITDILTTFRGTPNNPEARSEVASRIATEGIVASIEHEVRPDSRLASINRLYTAVFRRPPDYNGLKYWTETGANGLTVAQIADFFLQSSEYEQEIGSQPFTEFIEDLYQQVFGRPADPDGSAYWLDLLENQAVSRGDIVALFADSTEFQNLTRHRSEIVGLTALLEDRQATQDEIESWTLQRQNHTFDVMAKTTFGL